MSVMLHIGKLITFDLYKTYDDMLHQLIFDCKCFKIIMLTIPNRCAFTQRQLNNGC